MEAQTDNINLNNKNTRSREKCRYCCNKLDTFDWMNSFQYPDNASIPEIVEVRFKSVRKIFCKNPEKIKLDIGDYVVVESSSGVDIGVISLVSNLVKIQMKNRGYCAESDFTYSILRIANEKDLKNWEEVKNLEYSTMIKARQLSKELNLAMKINDVEFQADKKKATFYYTAEGRVDFRELIKVFAKNFRTKIEMRQIGIRQESGRVGGIGDCGRELCCSSWLTDFTTVPTIAAKQQNLYLNPAKLSGQCSRLKCCLNYELDSYLEAFENFPDENIILQTDKGKARVFKIDILKGWMWFMLENADTASPVPLHITNVNKIIDMNKKNIKVEISGFIEKVEVESDTPQIID
ncbi:stage 0 sporulation family protein [Bacteroidota bacterium]